MENQENTLINTENMKVDEHALVLIKNRLQQKKFPYQSCMKTLILIILMSLMQAQTIIK